MHYMYIPKNVLVLCTKTIIIIIVICCIFVSICNWTILFQYQNDKFTMRARENFQVSMIDYFQHDIHIALVCARNPFNIMALTTIKSIMFYHRKASNITFHVFTDSDGEKTILNYFNSFTNNCTKFRIYQIEKLLEKGKNFLEKHHIINTHYSGIYALSKAFIHEVLPSNVTHVLLIDTDILFVDDVFSIWKQFRLFKRNRTALGLVPWYPPVPINYTYKGSHPDPFLTGIVLLDLDVCRSIDFTRLLDQITETAYKQFGLRSLWTADQVILSLFATYFSEHFVALPCFVNGHTYHYLKDGPTWKDACNGEYPRSLHVVPSANLLKNTNYFGHLYLFFKDMPIEWLSYCANKQS